MSLAGEIIATARAMNAKGLNQGTSGNVSARTDDGFLVTPSGRDYESLTEDQIVPMDLEGGYRGPLLPSSEWRLHLDIYRARAEAGAVVHVHAPHATALSCLREEVPAFHYMIAVAGGATLRCTDYATFGTAALSDAMLVALEGRTACLLANHGMVAVGETLTQALWRAEEVEALCRQWCLARQAGQPVILDDAEMDRVIARFATYGKQPGELPEGAVPAVEAPARRD